MKTIIKTIITLSVLILSNYAFSQAPEGVNYQATVRDATGNLMINQTATVIFKIKKTSITGSNVYQETRTVTTNAYGGFALVIGEGTTSMGNFTAINWGDEDHFLNVTINGNDLGTTQMMSVPYALHAKTSEDSQWDKVGNDIHTNSVSTNVGIGTTTPKHKLAIGDTNATLAVGSFLVNSPNAGKLKFSERIDIPTDCGFTFDHNGATNTLNLDGGCGTADTIVSYTRDGNTRIKKLRVGSTSTNPTNALSVTGTVDVSGEINRTQTSSANLVPIAYGQVGSSGGKIAGASTSNWTVTKVTNGVYEITITGESFFYTNYTVLVTKRGSSGSIYSSSNSGKLRVFARALSTPHSLTDANFNFIVYKP